MATRTAVNVPVPQVSSGLRKLADAYVSTGATHKAAAALGAGDTITVPASLNKNARLSELASRYGSSNVHGIGEGLALSAGAGLILNVAAGHALISGTIIEIAAATTIVLLDASTSCVWLKDNGTLEAIAGSLAPPASPACLLGIVVTAAGAISSIDNSGVFQYKGGLAVRETADTGEPADAPNAAATFLTKTAADTYLWDGSGYLLLADLAKHQLKSYAKHTLVADLTLTRTSPNIHRIRCAAQRKVFLPANADCNFGHSFHLFNDNAGGGQDVLVRDAGDTITVATLNPGEFVDVPPSFDPATGNFQWPTTLTPQTSP